VPIGVNLRLKPSINLGFLPSLDPPKSPLRRGTSIGLLSPPTTRGARGDLGLTVKQHSVTGFDVQLTPMNSWSVPTTGHGSQVSLQRIYLN
jgi:hypothetical protein